MGDVSRSSTSRVREETFAIGGHCKAMPLDLQGSSSYATGGDNLSAKQCGFGQNGRILSCAPVLSNSGTYQIWPIQANEGGSKIIKLKFMVVATGAEVANATNLSAEKFTLFPIGVQN